MRRNWDKSEVEGTAKVLYSAGQQEGQQVPAGSADSELKLPLAQRLTIVQGSHSQPPQDMKEPDRRVTGILSRFRKLPGWQLGAILLVLISGGIGFSATSLLLKLPAATNCIRIFWPFASASTRIYCAQLKAEEKTLDGLLAAIALVEKLPEDHPLHAQINRNVEEWAEQILDLAEQEFQEGKIKEAMATARKIPSHLKAYSLVEARIEKWQTIWSKAEETYGEVERNLRKFNWNEAFREAVQLLYIGNEYWATTKYNESLKQIQIAQEESRKLDGAYVAYRRGGTDNLLEAIEIASQIGSQSYAYQEAQDLIDEAKGKLIKQIKLLVDNQNWQELLQIAQRLPENLDLKEEVRDWKTLASAGLSGQGDSVGNLEKAIGEAQEIAADSPVYHEAQQLIGRWKLEIEDLTYLSQARQLAQPGTVSDLNAAIAQAKLVPAFNPRYEEARREIRAWTRQIETIEDGPLLERAAELASDRSVAALQEAISQASLIGSNRALYQEAQGQITTWKNKIERQQDQPFLDQAVALAGAGNFEAAIDTAQQIGRGRVLYREAQGKISSWRREVKARVNLQEAYRIAQSKTPEALSRAISLALKVPNSTQVYRESVAAINGWGQDLLSIARSTATTSVKEAIAIAQRIPSGTLAYQSARSDIAVWETRPKQSPVLPPNPPASRSGTEVELPSPKPTPSVTEVDLSNPAPAQR